jgi:hypothetical protein
VKKIISWAAVIYSAGSLILTFFYDQLGDFPEDSITILGVLLIGISLYFLFNLEPIPQVGLYQHPMAWICISLILFYSGHFFLNGIFHFLTENPAPDFLLIHASLSKSLNCLMYFFFLIALLFSHRLKKYFLLHYNNSFPFI